MRKIVTVETYIYDDAGRMIQKRTENFEDEYTQEPYYIPQPSGCPYTLVTPTEYTNNGGK